MKSANLVVEQNREFATSVIIQLNYHDDSTLFKLILIKIEYSTTTNMKNLKNLNPCNRDILKKQVIRLIATCLLCSCAPTYGLRTIQNHPLYFEENMEPGDLLKIHLKNGDKVQLELVEFDQEKLVGRTVKKSKKSPVKLMDVYYEDVKVIYHFEKLDYSSSETYVDSAVFLIAEVVSSGFLCIF